VTVTRTNPAGLHPPTGYSHVVVGNGTFVHVSGQVAVDEAGAVVGHGDLGAQTRQVFRNLESALASAGATFADVVKLTTFIVDYRPEMLPAYRAERSRFIGDHLPASTLVGVQALALSDYLIEIEATAILEG